jgi:hypothetical protein
MYDFIKKPFYTDQHQVANQASGFFFMSDIDIQKKFHH